MQRQGPRLQTSDRYVAGVGDIQRTAERRWIANVHGHRVRQLKMNVDDHV